MNDKQAFSDHNTSDKDSKAASQADMHKPTLTEDGLLKPPSSANRKDK